MASCRSRVCVCVSVCGGRTLSMRVKTSSEYSATLSWMYILPPSLFFASRESA